MKILHFLMSADRREIKIMALLAVIAGLANAGLVVMLNEIAGIVALGDKPGFIVWLIFSGSFLIYYQCNTMALLRANILIEQRLNQVRLDVVNSLRQSELAVADKYGRSTLYSLVANETNHLSVAFPLMVDSAQQAVLLFFSLLYLLYLSPMAFFVFIAAVGAGIFSYVFINRRFRDTLATLAAYQADMLKTIDATIRGAKELRLNTARSVGVQQTQYRLSHALEDALVAAGEHWAAMILLTSFVTYLMLGVIGFVFPHFVQGHGVIVFQLIPVLLFCIGPLSKIVAQSPMFLRAESGLANILAVQHGLEEAGAVPPAEARQLAKAFHDFQTVSYENLTFNHKDANGEVTFKSGPLTLAFARGEVVFFTGGNGSGKSTAMKLLCGLYAPEAGTIRVDGKALSGQDIAGFREQFTSIFVDFHLFDRLYGLHEIEPARVNDLIAEMGLAHKVTFKDGRFTTLQLSTGQRKRLAMIVALLEDRPVYLFDEYAAEQDVHYREHFYKTILPALKSRGKLVIAVTHDERYWHVADRVIRLDLGRIVWDRPGDKAGTR